MTSGVLYALAFPPYNAWPLAWVSLVPLLAQTRISFFRGLLAGFIANVIIFSWLWDTFHAARIGSVTTALVWCLLALVLGVYVGIFTWVVSFVRNAWLAPLFAGASWVCLESVRSVLLTGFPWALLSHTQARNTAFLQLASLTGAPGLSFLIVAFNTALANAVRHSRLRHS